MWPNTVYLNDAWERGEVLSVRPAVNGGKHMSVQIIHSGLTAALITQETGRLGSSPMYIYIL